MIFSYPMQNRRERKSLGSTMGKYGRGELWADAKHTAFPFRYVTFALSVSKTDNSRRCLLYRIHTSQPLSDKPAKFQVTLPRFAASAPAVPLPALTGSGRRVAQAHAQVQPVPAQAPEPAARGRRQADPCRQRRRIAAPAAPHFQGIRAHRHLHRSAGEFRRRAAEEKQQVCLGKELSGCAAALHGPARSSPAAPVAPRDPLGERGVAERNNPPFSGKIYLHGSAEPNKQGDAPAHNPVPTLKAKDAESQTRRAPRLPRTAPAAAGGSAPHYRITSSALCVARLISIRNAPAMPAPRRKRPLSRLRMRGVARPPVRHSAACVESRSPP